MPFLSLISWVVNSSLTGKKKSLSEHSFLLRLRNSRNTTKWFSVLFSGADSHAQARTKNTGV